MKKILSDFYHHLVYNKKFRPLKIYKNRAKRPVTLPRDDGFLPDQEVQWWYWTGHLETEDKRKFGFEICFFAFDSWIVFKNQLIQAAITDSELQSYKFEEYLRLLSLPKKIKNRFNLFVKSKNEIKISAIGNKNHESLYAEIDNYKLNLKLDSTQDPVIHYDGKAHQFSFGGYTYYYSRETMKTSGTISVDGKELKVTGTSWFDRQYGDLYDSIFKGWQWFAIELNDGRSIMLYDFLKETKEKYGSVTMKNKTNEFNGESFDVKVLDKWKSPHTEITYPSGWEVNCQNETFIVKPILVDQELRAKHNFWIGPEYWEGDCKVTDKSGVHIGDAYVELNGFGNKVISIDGGFGV